MAKTMLAMPDTSMKDYIDAEQAAERLRDGFADYFQRYDALLTPGAADPGPQAWHLGIRHQRTDGGRRPTCKARPCR